MNETLSAATSEEINYFSNRVAIALSKSGYEVASAQRVDGAISNVYNALREEVLANHYWAFAAAPAVLQASTEKPVWGYPFLFDLPSDYLSMELISSDDTVRHTNLKSQVFGNKLAAEFSNPKIIYTKNVKDVTLFRPTFVNALVLRLASEICLDVTGDKDLDMRLIRKYQMLHFEALEADYREQDEAMEDTSFADARRGYSAGSFTSPTINVPTGGSLGDINLGHVKD